MVNQTPSSFDPMSSSSTTASCIAVLAVLCLCLGAFNLGKQRNNRESSLFQVSWWSIPSAVCLLITALCIFFMYD